MRGYWPVNVGSGPEPGSIDPIRYGSNARAFGRGRRPENECLGWASLPGDHGEPADRGHEPAVSDRREVERLFLVGDERPNAARARAKTTAGEGSRIAAYTVSVPQSTNTPAISASDGKQLGVLHVQPISVGRSTLDRKIRGCPY